MNRIKKLALGLVAGVSALIVALGAQTAFAVTCPEGTPGAGRSDVNSLAECSLSDTSDTFMPILQQIINVVISVLGIVAVLMIILGGVTYTTSQGDASKIAKARNTIIYGVIGLVISLLAFAIVNFVLDNVFKNADNGSSSTDSSQTTNN